MIIFTKELGTMFKNSLRGITLRGITINSLNPSYSIGHTVKSHLNPLLPKSDLQILLCLTADVFTRQRETLRA